MGHLPLDELKSGFCLLVATITLSYGSSMLLHRLRTPHIPNIL